MRLLFYQPNYTGHHLAYLARMLPGFRDLPAEIVVATTPQALESDEYRRTLAPLAAWIRFETCCTGPSGGTVSKARHRYRELVQAIGTLAPDHVAVCYADGIWELACLSTLLGRRPWPRGLAVEGWIYRGRFGDVADHRWKSVIRRGIFRRLLRQGLFAKLHLHHELLYEFARPQAERSPTQVELAADPIQIRPPQSGTEARRELGVTGDGRWIGMAGVIARYKGAELFLEAYRLRREAGASPVHALLAGPHHEDVRAMLREPPYREWVADGSIVSVDRFLDENDMFAAASAVDVLVAPYPHHQNRSSIILWGAAAGRPCVGSDESCVGFVIRQEQLGLTCNVLDTRALATAISAALEQAWTADDVARVRRYAEFHRVENYQRLSSALVRSRLSG
jgi:glycosyltransferase involved in cell wall biosynthesis